MSDFHRSFVIPF